MRKLLIVCLIFASLLIGCKKEESIKSIASDTVVLRYAESEKKGTYQSNLSNYFANLVKEKSEGKITIKVYYGGELGTEKQVLTQLQFGGIALGRVNLLSVSEQIPSFKSNFYPLINMPFDRMQNYIRESDDFNFVFQNEKLFPLTILSPGLRCIYSDEALKTSKNELDDNENELEISVYSKTKIGIDNSEMYKNFLSESGANPIVLGNIATFPSLRNGFIDARESSVSSFLSSDEYPYIKEVVILDNITLPSFILISNEVLNQLTRDELNLLLECANSTLKYAKNYINIEEIKAIRKIDNDKIMRRI
jgi:TRAP-type C4-dicarboxylate transport system substrate-binding protein